MNGKAWYIMNNSKKIVSRIFGIGTIPVATLIILLVLCGANGVKLFESTRHWNEFFRSVTTVMLTTFALSLNLNSGRFDFSLGSISLLSSVISSLICIEIGVSAPVMLIISVVTGIVLGFVSGLVYVLIKLPPIIISLGVALFYEGLAFTITDGKGISFFTIDKLMTFKSVQNYLILIVVALLIVVVLFDYTRFGYQYKALMSNQKVSVNTGIKEVPNALGCYAIAGGLMGAVGFVSATNAGNIEMAVNFGSIGVMFTAFLPMFIGGFIGRFCNERIGYVLGAATTSLISLTYARLNVETSIQQITTALLLVGFLIYLNNESRIRGLFSKRKN